MMRGLTRRIFGTANERVVKAYAKQIDAINSLESGWEALSDEALRARTGELRERLAKNADLGFSLYDSGHRLLTLKYI